ncbi:MAG: hypothetical protein AAB225_06015 [Acidobacteriota bacterium]
MTTRILLALVATLLLAAQDLPRHRTDVRLPSGKSQAEEILKADHEKSLQDAATLVKLAEEIKADLEKNDRHVLSLATLKKTEEIERLARRIKSRLRRF